MSQSKDNPVEKRIVVYCCDSNGVEFTINYFPYEEALIYAFDTEEVDASKLSLLFADVDLKDFVELQYLLITLGENLSMDIIEQKRLTLVEKVEVVVIKREETEELQ